MKWGSPKGCIDLASLGVKVVKALRGECSDVSERWGVTRDCKATQLARYLWRCLEVYQRFEDLASVLIGLCYVRDWGVGGECARVYSGQLSEEERRALYWYYHNARLCIPYVAEVARLRGLELYSVTYL